jgi:dsRNA-specific ribonuclease
LPEYELQREEGAEHAKKFYVTCRIPDDEIEVEASGSSRRMTEQAAAQQILLLLKESVA